MKKFSVFLLAGLLGIMVFCGRTEVSAQTDWVFIGGYTQDVNDAMKELGVEPLKGIYTARYDEKTGELSEPRLAAEIGSPNFFAFSPDNTVLYTCCAGEAGNLAAFKINAKDGSLTKLNQTSNGSGGCCHVAVSPDGKWLASSNYTAGDFVINRINEDGSIGDIFATIVKPGTGPEPVRQTHPYGHSAYFVPDGDILRLFLVDLGTDRVMILRFDPETGAISDDPDIPALHVPAGAGCRHLAWHAWGDGKFDVFVNNELDSTVSFFTLEFGKGSDGLTYWGTWLTVPEEFRGKVWWDQGLVDSDPDLELMNSTAETMYRENGGGNPPTVAVSNRGHNSIAVFQILEKNGIRSLSPIQYAETFGNAPRYFCYDFCGDHAIVANKRTGTIYTFNIKEDGTFEAADFEPVKVGWPCALALLPIEE